MKIDNKIFGIQFKRSKKKHHKIVFLLEKEIPAMGYGTQEIVKLLGEFKKQGNNNLGNPYEHFA